jgi:hypothetical protein
MSQAGLFLALLGAQTVQAAPIDLNSWTQESYPAVSGFGAGNWTPAIDGSSVLQSVNGQPTFFYSDFNNTFGSSFSGTIRVGNDGDDDFIGFALGFQAGDTTNANADYLLIDWKQGTQGFDFGAPSLTPGSTAPAGLAVSRVTGVPTADEFWGHTDFSAAQNGGAGGLQELQRATNLGNSGYLDNTDYIFTFDFGPQDLEVFVNGVKELDINVATLGLLSNFNDGKFAFYNFSQSSVTYSGFTQDIGTFPTVPVPAAVWLFGTAMIGLAGFGRRKKIV